MAHLVHPHLGRQIIELHVPKRLLVLRHHTVHPGEGRMKVKTCHTDRLGSCSGSSTLFFRSGLLTNLQQILISSVYIKVASKQCCGAGAGAGGAEIIWKNRGAVISYFGSAAP